MSTPITEKPYEGFCFQRSPAAAARAHRVLTSFINRYVQPKLSNALEFLESIADESTVDQVRLMALLIGCAVTKKEWVGIVSLEKVHQFIYVGPEGMTRQEIKAAVIVAKKVFHAECLVDWYCLSRCFECGHRTPKGGLRCQICRRFLDMEEPSA